MMMTMNHTGSPKDEKKKKAERGRRRQQEVGEGRGRGEEGAPHPDTASNATLSHSRRRAVTVKS